MENKYILKGLLRVWNKLTMSAVREFYSICEEMKFGERKEIDIKPSDDEVNDHDFCWLLGKRLSEKFATPQIRKQFELRIDRERSKFIIICHEIPPNTRSSEFRGVIRDPWHDAQAVGYWPGFKLK